MTDHLFCHISLNSLPHFYFSEFKMAPKGKQPVQTLPNKKSCPACSLFNKAALKSYAATFGAGYFSGICGEFVTLAQGKNLDAKHIAAPQFWDLCTISGVQQVAKELSKNTIKLFPAGKSLAAKNPFVFGALTGFPMWALTRLFGTPLQNLRKKDAKTWDGLKSTIVADTPYHTIKNGLDQVSADIIFPAIIPKVNGFWAKRAVEGTISAIVGAGTYVLAWPIKQQITGQSLPQAFQLCKKNFPKVFVKKVSYTVIRPYLVKGLN